MALDVKGNVEKNLKFLLGAVACFTVATMIIKGTSGIVFADPINEMFTFALVGMGGIIFTALIKK
jgi:energy-converting hydrogenase Eha subunit C